jgi:hypothetical protein
MPVQISDLWTPAEWTRAMKEGQATYPSLFNSGVCIENDFMDGLASGPGTSVNVPFLKDITDQQDEIQVENTPPVNDQGQSGDVQNFPLLNRVTKNSVTALSAQVSGADPMASIINSLTERRLKQRQQTLIAMLRGLFGSAGAANAACALSGNRLGGSVNEPFSESGLGASDANMITPDLFIDAESLLGELADGLANGCLLMHPNVRARLKKLDVGGFGNVTLRQSQFPFTISTYRDIPIFTSASLVRAGTVSGWVYDTYLICKGTIGFGSKPQSSDVADVASLSYFFDRDKNNEAIWDRTRFLMGIDGTKWVGVPGGQSATNAELQVATNWQLKYQTSNRVSAVCFRTNG